MAKLGIARKSRVGRQRQGGAEPSCEDADVWGLERTVSVICFLGSLGLDQQGTTGEIRDGIFSSNWASVRQGGLSGDKMVGESSDEVMMDSS